MAMVVKRKGHKEKFDERKLYASIYAACASAHYDEAACEKIAGKVTKKIVSSFKKKKEIQTAEIHKRTEAEIRKTNKELAFFYDQHLPNLKKL